VQREIVDINLVAFLFLSRVFFALFFLLFFLLRLFEIFTFSRSSVSCLSLAHHLTKKKIHFQRKRYKTFTHTRTRNRIRERQLLRVHTIKRSLQSRGGFLKKKQRENTPTYSFLHFLLGRPFEFVYFNNGALFARVNTNTSFSLIHAKSRRPVFLSYSTEKMLFDTLARFSSSTCVRVHARLARTKPTIADGFSSSLI